MHSHPDTEVAIIGNGPAGLCLSAFLSGVSPFYSPITPHPDPLLHQRLSENAAESLLDQDLSWAYGWDEMGSSTLRPLSSLYDTLVRPEADLGAELGSCLHWEQNPSKCVDHIVLGETAIGGSWTTYDKEMVAVSFHNWLDLPGFSISDWLGGKLLIPRIPTAIYTKYMEKYARHLGLKKNIRSHTKVTSIKKEGQLWRVKGVTTKCGVKWQTFSLTARRVVMACGKTKQRTLQVEGEADEKNIVYDMKTLRKRITKLLAHKSVSTSTEMKVVVVGDGISSADMVGFCLSQGIRVIHIIKRNEKQLRSTVMSRLSAGNYAEYHSIYRLMTARESHPLYERRINSQVTRLVDGKAYVSTKDSGIEMEIPYSLLGVCIGRISEGMGLLDRKYTFSDYTSEEDPTLMCVGSFAGDHFVRYVVGGTLDVARTIHKALRTPPSIKESDQTDLSRSFCSSSSNSSDSLPSC